MSTFRPHGMTNLNVTGHRPLLSHSWTLPVDNLFHHPRVYCLLSWPDTTSRDDCLINEARVFRFNSNLLCKNGAKWRIVAGENKVAQTHALSCQCYAKCFHYKCMTMTSRLVVLWHICRKNKTSLAFLFLLSLLVKKKLLM